jgi:hypothetical protein
MDEDLVGKGLDKAASIIEQKKSDSQTGVACKHPKRVTMAVFILFLVGYAIFAAFYFNQSIELTDTKAKLRNMQIEDSLTNQQVILANDRLVFKDAQLKERDNAIQDCNTRAIFSDQLVENLKTQNILLNASVEGLSVKLNATIEERNMNAKRANQCQMGCNTLDITYLTGSAEECTSRGKAIVATTLTVYADTASTADVNYWGPGKAALDPKGMVTAVIIPETLWGYWTPPTPWPGYWGLVDITAQVHYFADKNCDKFDAKGKCWSVQMFNHKTRAYDFCHTTDNLVT